MLKFSKFFLTCFIFLDFHFFCSIFFGFVKLFFFVGGLVASFFAFFMFFTFQGFVFFKFFLLFYSIFWFSVPIFGFPWAFCFSSRHIMAAKHLETR